MAVVQEYPTTSRVHEHAAENPLPMELAVQIAESHTWNKKQPAEVLRSVHGYIKKRTEHTPQAEAINSWDGSLTYQELDELSDSLISALPGDSIKAETVVPLCFEKSKWTIVTILAVMKMGAAFLLLDPSHPAARVEYMIKTVNADIVLCSPLYAEHEAFTELRHFIVDKTTVKVADGMTNSRLKLDENPYAALYIMFTSGTTGMPKGFTIEHRAFCSSALARASVISRNENSRVLQFAAFTFDPCMEDMLTTLMVGGCICIPSDMQRVNDLAKCIRDLHANFINITPGVSDLLEPLDVPGLEILLLSGESMKERHIEKWSPHLQLINGYGPSECCIKCAVNPKMVPGTKPNNIGHPIGSSLWIVDPSSLQVLPVGTEGELLIEGPTLARGYLQKNATESFVEAPLWLKTFRNNSEARVYKTGDLAVYREDGSIDFIGRRDTQAKINGQRVELAEIESLISKVTEGKYRVVAEVMTLENEQQPTLIACIADAETPNGTYLLEERLVSQPTSIFVHLFESLPQQLATWLPRYMIPSIYVSVKAIPLTIHGKTDRKRLRYELAKLNRSSIIGHIEDEDTAVNVPLNSQEEALLRLWSQVLEVPLPHRRKNLSFFQLGGDSFAAIRLVAAARRANLHLTVADILQNPELSHQALAAKELVISVEKVSETPFSLIGPDLKRSLESVAEQSSVDPSAIEDVYPCTPLQSYWIDYTLDHPDELQALWVYSVPNHVNIPKLQKAWNKVVLEFPILRARANKLDGWYMQSISNAENEWEEWNSLQEFLKHRTPHKFCLGQPLTRSAVIVDPISNEQFFALTSHHSAWDGWSKKMFLQRLNDRYNDEGSPALTTTSFSQLLGKIHVTDEELHRRFWESQLSNLNLTPFYQNPVEKPAQPKAYNFNLSYTSTGCVRSITMSTIVQAAWALVVHENSPSDSVILTVLLSGREYPLPGVEEIVAPTVAQIPLRVSIDLQMKVVAWLESIQQRLISAIPFMHTDWNLFRTQLGTDVQQAWESSPLIVIHPVSEDGPENEILPLGMKQVERIFSHKIPFTVECYVSPTTVKTDIFFDETVFSSTAVQTLCGHFKTYFHRILDPENNTMHSVTL